MVYWLSEKSKTEVNSGLPKCSLGPGTLSSLLFFPFRAQPPIPSSRKAAQPQAFLRAHALHRKKPSLSMQATNDPGAPDWPTPAALEVVCPDDGIRSQGGGRGGWVAPWMTSKAFTPGRRVEDTPLGTLLGHTGSPLSAPTPVPRMSSPTWKLARKVRWPPT